MSRRIRAVVIDDSALMRKVISRMLERDALIEVVATAVDGEFGLKKIEELQPDVVTLDLQMPGMDGLEMLRQLRRKSNVPVVIVSAYSTAGAAATLRSLALGAFDFVAKPRDASAATMENIESELISKITAAVRFGMGRRCDAAELAPVSKTAVKRQRAAKVVAIGASTGGPNALQQTLSALPADFPAALVIAQHMPPGFTAAFAARLDECCAIDVKEAADGELLVAGQALIAPGDRHIEVKRTSSGWIAALSHAAPVKGHRPAIDLLFRSVAHEVRRDAVAVLMTGMGEDGAEAMAEIKAAGGLTIAQDEASSIVFGMPRVAIERGHAMRVVSLDVLPAALQAACGGEFSIATAANAISR
jgi:two-component system, chemotaxis family, protein-glutamate methylesterase/glutaminase